MTNPYNKIDLSKTVTDEMSCPFYDGELTS